MVEGLKWINISLRFVLELLGLFIYGFWGYKLGESGVMKWGLALGIPIFVAFIWGLLGSPKANYRLPEISRIMLELPVFLLPGAILIGLGYTGIGWGFCMIVIINRIILFFTDSGIAV